MLGLLLIGCHTTPVPTLWIGGDVHMGAQPHPLHELPVDGAGFVNLEGPIGTGASADDGSLLSNAPEVLDALREGGVRYVGVANNHQDDLGATGRDATRAAIERAGLVPVGPEGVEADGRVLVQLGVDDPPVFPQTDLPLVVAVHTTERTYLPTPALREVVAAAHDAGAVLVVVHGSHLVGPVEAGTVWGLGNLVFRCPCSTETDAVVARVTDLSEPQLELIPVRAGHGGPATAGGPGVLELVRALE
jgi:hypothetical protein